MVRLARRRFRSLSSKRWSVAVLVAVILMLFASSCSGSEPRKQEAEQDDETSRQTDTDGRIGQTEERDTSQDVDPPTGQRKLRALVWVGVEDADQLVLINLATGTVLARHDTPGGPHNVTVADDGTAAVALYASDRLALIGRTRARLLELGGTPHDVKVTGDLFVVANEAARRIDLVRRGRQAGSIRLKAEPHDLAITPGGEKAWVTLNGTDELAIVDLRARRLVRYLNTGARPHDILFAPDGRVWVTDWSGPVHVFDRRGRLHGRIELARESHHLAFTPDGREAWVTDHGARRIFVVDTRRLERIASLPIRGAPHHVAIIPSGTLAAVADHDNGTLAVYDLRRRTLVRTVRVGAGPHGVWAVPEHRTG
jgi:streptogramin lyase